MYTRGRNTARGAADIALADIALPDITLAGIALPDIALPDITLADITLADIALPDIALPDITLADITLPDIALPGIASHQRNDSPARRRGRRASISRNGRLGAGRLLHVTLQGAPSPAGSDGA